MGLCGYTGGRGGDARLRDADARVEAPGRGGRGRGGEETLKAEHTQTWKKWLCRSRIFFTTKLEPEERVGDTMPAAQEPSRPLVLLSLQIVDKPFLLVGGQLTAN